MLTQLRPTADPTLYEAIDELGQVVATGYLEVDYLPGAQRHGTVSFVTPEREEVVTTEALQAGAQAATS